MKSWQGFWQPHNRGIEAHYNKVLHTFLIDDEAWSIFKVYPTYNGIVGGDAQPREIAEFYYNRIKEEFPHLFAKLAEFVQSDCIGAPLCHEFDGITISAGTLAYVYILGDMERQFGPLNTGTRIIEIGGGYGGQMVNTLIHQQVATYALVDLKLAILVAQKYLQYFPNLRANTAISYYDTDLLPEEPSDLVISNFCLTELDDAGIDCYLENIFANSQNCYILSNFKATPHVAQRENGRQERLVEKLEEIYEEVLVEEFLPGLSDQFTVYRIIGRGAKNAG